MNKTDTTHIAFVPQGDSMWPFLKNKKQTVIVDKSIKQIKQYDVILYQRDNGDNVLHRVIKVTDDFITCSGDSQFVLEKVYPCQVIGVMVGYYKKDKYVETDQEYRDKVKKYYKNTTKRKLKVKTYFFTKRVFNKIRRVFRGK